ncbi:MAG: hypothetical protein LWX23_03750, partial [Spirochaetia bacterium]|nr:hypothetical protein [Spirochaetia bacterium]
LSLCVLCLLTGTEAAKDFPAKWDIEIDVLVVGFGAADSAAHDAGADVLIVDYRQRRIQPKHRDADSLRPQRQQQ